MRYWATFQLVHMTNFIYIENLVVTWPAAIIIMALIIGWHIYRKR